MRYFLVAVLAFVLALPPASVRAGIDIPPDSFFIQAAREDGNSLILEYIFCGDLGSPNVWVLVVADESGQNLEAAYAGTGAKVSGKGGVKMKDKGSMQLFDNFPVRPRGGPDESEVSGSMSASFKPKTLTATAKVVDKTNSSTVEIDSEIRLYVIANILLPGGCQDLIDSLVVNGPIPQSVRELGR